MRQAGFAWTLVGLLLAAVPGWAATITVTTGTDQTVNGQNLNAAINNARLGDTIILQAGATYYAPHGFAFGNKPGGTGTDADYITVQSSNMAGCPAAGVRVNPPVHAAAMPKLVAGGYPVIDVLVRAHHWKFVCLEVTNDGSAYTADLIHTVDHGSAPGGYATYDETVSTHHIVFDRLFVHSHEVTASNLNPSNMEVTAGRGMSVDGANVWVQNSWIGSFAGYYPGTTTKTDSYGVYAGPGPGPLTITNNQIQAWFNSIFLTGASMANPAYTATISGGTLTSATLSNTTGLNVGDIIAIQVPPANCANHANTCFQTAMVDSIGAGTVTYHAIGPSPTVTGDAGKLSVPPLSGGHAQWNGLQIGNVTISNNYLYKPPQWETNFPQGCKLYIEIKALVTGLIEGNTFQGAGCGAITFELKAMAPNNGSPWATIKNVTVRNNLLLDNANAIYTPLLDYEQTSTPGHDILITNNLWQKVRPTTSGVRVSGFLQTQGGYNVTVTHNTVRNAWGSAVVYNGGPGKVVNGQDFGQRNIVFKDNIIDYGAYGFNYNNPNGYRGAWPPNGIVESTNVVINSAGRTDPSPTQPGELPNSYIVPNDGAVGFVNAASADGGGDYHGYALASTSPFKGRASDGTDPGVNFAALDAALRSGGSPPSGPRAPTDLQVR